MRGCRAALTLRKMGSDGTGVRRPDGLRRGAAVDIDPEEAHVLTRTSNAAFGIDAAGEVDSDIAVDEPTMPPSRTLDRPHADDTCDALIARLILQSAQRERTEPRSVRPMSSLPAWRLRRALAFIEANFAQPIGLADVAASTGLTRMHFAAQFRATTGCSPHAYLLQRRIEHAQTLLRSSAQSVLDVALSCGFCSHAHFTTVFRRMVGEPPTSWRTRVLGDAPALATTAAGAARRGATGG
jgi:AraC-like DNA-binding protein